MDCPRCSCPLIVVEREGVELDYCIACKGIWFDTGELALLSQALNIDANLPDMQSIPATRTKEKPRPCPRCDKKMDKILLENVLVDRCARGHGLWFDWGEVGQVLERAATGGQEIIRFLGESIRPSAKAG